VGYPLQRRRGGNPDTPTGFVSASETKYGAGRPEPIQPLLRRLEGLLLDNSGKLRAGALRSSH
jgi:hypothetical protein